MGFFYYFGIAAFALGIGVLTWNIFFHRTGEDTDGGTTPELISFLKESSGWFRLVVVPEDGRTLVIIMKGGDRIFFYLKNDDDLTGAFPDIPLEIDSKQIISSPLTTDYDTIVNEGGKVFKVNGSGQKLEVKMSNDAPIRSK